MPPSNQVRIIGGRFRGRKLAFADLPGLRPTGDRMRETLFNWLQYDLPGAHCLDLFAGSGALGLEAGSRGAAHLTLVDQAPQVVWQLRENLRILGMPDAQVIQADALKWLLSPSPESYDVVFLDPPFADGLLGDALEALKLNGWLAAAALIYLENDSGKGLPQTPAGFELYKQKKMGRVEFGLIRYLGDAGDTARD